MQQEYYFILIFLGLIGNVLLIHQIHNDVTVSQEQMVEFKESLKSEKPQRLLSVSDIPFPHFMLTITIRVDDVETTPCTDCTWPVQKVERITLFGMPTSWTLVDPDRQGDENRKTYSTKEI